MSILAEFQHAARSLARAPGLVALAVVSLGLGIGANATIFNFVNAIEFQPLPFPEPERLMDVSEANPAELCAGCGVGTAYPTFQFWRRHAASFTAVSPGDPVVFGAVGMLLAGVSMLACWRPAERATRVDPLIALRAE